MKNKAILVINFRCFYSIVLKSLIFCLILGGFFVISNQAKAWSEPTDTPPGGNVAAPLNTSASSQTKLGPLTLGDLVEDEAGILRLVPGDKSEDPCEAENAGEIYYNTSGTVYYCNGSVWTQLATGASGNFVVLNGSNLGWTELVAQATDQFAIQGKGSDHVNWSAGISGLAGLDTHGQNRYGVYGRANIAVEGSSGIYGYDGGYANNYAGYFLGNVHVEAGTGDSSKLRLGPEVQLCFGIGDSDCASTWGAVGGGLWTAGTDDATGAPLAYLGDTESDVVVGSTTPQDSEFFINVNNWGSVVIGNPQQLINPAHFCGDGICQNQGPAPFDENNITCDQDCAPFVSAVSMTTHTTSADFVWNVDEEVSESYIEYGETDSYGLKTLPSIENQGPGILSETISGLIENTTYHYTIYSIDQWGNYSYTSDNTFIAIETVPSDPCGDGFCDSGNGETCATCNEDCVGKTGIFGGCATPSDRCCADTQCRECCNSANCSGLNGFCCVADGYQCNECCQKSDCDFNVNGSLCCANFSCNDDCSKYGGEIIPHPVQVSLPLACLEEEANPKGTPSGKEEKNLVSTGRVMGQKTSKLSSSLLIPEVKAATEWFKNIIPVAQAAQPIDAPWVTTNPRKLTIYGGVATIINGDANGTLALEVGRYTYWNPSASGMGITSSGDLHLFARDTVNEVTQFLWLDDETGDLSAPGKLYIGKQSSHAGDLSIWRDGSCVARSDGAGGCRAITNFETANKVLTLNYEDATGNGPDFAGGVATSGKFYAGFIPDAAAATNNDTLMVKNNIVGGTSVYAEQNNAGYAGWFAGKVRMNDTTTSPYSVNALEVHSQGSRDGVGAGSTDSTIRAALYAEGGTQTRGNAIWGDVVTYNGDNPAGDLYAGKFTCTGPFDYGPRCWAAQFSGRVSIVRPENWNFNEGDQFSDPSRIALSVRNEINKSPIGIKVEIPDNDYFYGSGPKEITGLKIDMGNPQTVATGGSGEQADFSYALYAKASTLHSGAINRYAGYFEGDVKITGHQIHEHWSFDNTDADNWAMVPAEIYNYRREIVSNGILCINGKDPHSHDILPPQSGQPAFCCKINHLEGCTSFNSVCIIGCMDHTHEDMNWGNNNCRLSTRIDMSSLNKGEVMATGFHPTTHVCQNYISDANGLGKVTIWR